MQKRQKLSAPAMYLCFFALIYQLSIILKQIDTKAMLKQSFFKYAIWLIKGFVACHLFDANPLSELMLVYCLIGPLGTNFSVNLDQTLTIFVHKNSLENIVCKIVFFVSAPRFYPK